MHILQLIDTLSWGGAEKLQLTFAREARARGHRLTVIGLKHIADAPYPPMLTALDAEVDILPGSSLLNIGRIMRLTGFLRREQVDILHTHLAYANIIGALAGALAGVPVVATLHSIGTDPRHYHPLRFRLEKWALGHARGLILVADAVADAYAAILPDRNMHIIPNPVEPVADLSPPGRTALRSELTGDPARPLLISVGRLSPPKGYYDLLQAFAALHQEIPAAYLIIAGDGALFDELTGQIAALNLEKHARLLGARPDVPRLLAASDIYVSASHREGLPLATLEAMSAGLPVVTTSVGGVPELVAGRGVLLPPRRPEALTAALIALLNDPARQHSLGTAARAHVNQHYAPSPWFEQILAVYREVRRET